MGLRSYISFTFCMVMPVYLYNALTFGSAGSQKRRDKRKEGNQF